MSKQDEANPVFWLANRLTFGGGWTAAFRLPALFLQQYIFSNSYPFTVKDCFLNKAGYWPNRFLSITSNKNTG